jgi:phospholipid transport system substrate-binding protein
MMIKHISIAWIFALSLLVSNAQATEVADQSDPFHLVRVVADSLFKRIAKEQTDIQKNPEVLRVIVEEELAPSINHKYAAAKILGSHYRKTTEEERDRFYTAFREYLIATYAGILTLYKDQKVIFEPPYPIDDQKIVMVKTRVLDEGKPDIDISFKLRVSSKSGEWSAYDMIANGISVLDSKRAELENLIRQQGLDSVSELLKDKAAKPIVVKEL